MRLSSHSFDGGQAIPEEFAFCRPDPATHAALSANLSPHLAWSEVPEGVRSFALLCRDPDVPTVGDDVNQEGRTVPADLPRTSFTHWVMVGIPAGCRELEAGACSKGVTPRGKTSPRGPAGARQGRNDYTGWFAGDAEMAGTYLGYDGPGPPWNDALVHRYVFEVFALDVPDLPVEGAFGADEVVAAMEGHVLAHASLTGTYTMNPSLR